MLINRRRCLALCALTLCQSTLAEPPRTVKAPKRNEEVSDTEVELILLTGATAAAEHAQSWGQRLQKFDIKFQTRQAISGDKPDVTEKKLGRLRQVTVVAQLDRGGKIVCRNRSFTLADADKLAEWLRELKTYGAQGAPTGQPHFGLDESQFHLIVKSLSVPVEVETKGLTLDALLQTIPLPREHPVRLSAEAERAIRNIPRDKAVAQSLAGLSLGTALAASLAEFGLTFRPLRTPSAKIELAVSARSDDVDAWPIGWPLDASKPQGQQVPALFRMVPVELNDVPLSDVLVAAAEASETPIVIDFFQLEKQGTSLSDIKVTVTSRKTAWATLLREITTSNKLGRNIQIDDAGRPFVLITTQKEALKKLSATKSPDR